MDSHHDMVMRERERAQNSPPVHYFAYSTILDRAAFVEWRGQHGYDAFDLPPGRIARALDVALVYDFPSRWWGGRAAGLTDRPGAEVHGLLFEIAGVDWPIIRHKEGAITNMAIERKLRVSVDGAELDAVAFATRPERRSNDGPVSERFVQALVSGARSAGLPEAWIAEIQAGR